MSSRPKRDFNPEFRHDAAQLVVNQHYTIREAAEAMNVGYSTMDKWARQLREERSGISLKATPMTPDQLKIRELENVFAVVPTYGYRSFTQALHHIVKYLLGYYSQLRPHQHNDGMSPNRAEENYWRNYKPGASFT